jgi:hypothetical protein
MYSRVILNFLLVLVQGTSLNRVPNLAGTYAFAGTSEKSRSGEIVISPNVDLTFNFYLTVNRGAPSYNMGEIYGRAFVQPHKGIWMFHTDTTNNINCALTFSFEKGIVTVKTLNGGDKCGFGYGVFADGKYKLINKKNPTYFINLSGDTIYFNNVTPEKYNKN